MKNCQKKSTEFHHSIRHRCHQSIFELNKRIFQQFLILYASMFFSVESI